MVVLTDQSRDDPYAPKKEKRTVVLSAYYPVAEKSDCKTKLTKYMPDNTAKVVNQDYLDFGIPQGTLASIRLSMW